MRLRTALIPVIIGAAVGLSAGAAMADASTPGTFTYAQYGTVNTCNETHHDTNDLPAVITKDNPGAVTKGGYDELTCKLVTPSAALAGKEFTEFWVSDYVYVGPNTLPPGTDVNTGFATLQFSGSGGIVHGWAWYPNN